MTYPHFVAIEQQSSALDAAGQQLQTWTTYRSVWVRLEPLTGRELMLEKQVHAEVSFRASAHYVPGITPAMRVKYGTRLFNILAVMNIDERGKKMKLLCSEVA